MSDPGARSKIVVGVDGSRESLEALRWAVNEARLRGMDVDAIAAWQPTAPYAFAPDSVTGDYSDHAERMLDDAVGKAKADVPDVSIRTLAVEGSAARVLTEHPDEGDLLVVGSRGHGGFAGLRLGSVSNHSVQHAPCTVVVVRSPHKAK